MAMVINTNIASLNAQRNLGSSQKSMSEAMQRLSSGLRINSAKDDAAGLAIATRFTTQINGLNQAARNANDGISLAQTGESALQEVTNNLQRIRELAIQSANSTNSADDRTALDAEVQQRITEINRISSQTSFNGQKVLDGSMGAASFQIGANVGETINIDLSQSMQTTSIGSIVSTTSGDVTANALADGVLTLAVGTGTATSVAGSAAYAGSATGQEAASAFAKAAAINATGPSGLTATASNTVTYGFGAVSGGDDTDDFLLTLNGVEIMNIPAATGAGAAINALDETSIAAAINAVTDLTGVSAVAGTGDLTLTSFDGRDISLTQDSTDAGTGTFDVDTMG
ncbi:MAG: flagellin, partial [Sinobacterium sp.]|nr:flagellin [Sinobacterium sp.]